MTFKNDDGEVLEVDGNLNLTKRSVNVLNGSIQGDFSVNFEVDNNSENRKKLGYYGPQMKSQVAFQRQTWTATRNGNPYIRGSIVIQKDNGKTLSCFFLSGNSNWFNLLMSLITELDYSGITNGTNYETQITETNIVASFSATSGVIFPMIDWGYDLNKGNHEFFISNLLDISRDNIYKPFWDFYPCFFLHSLVSEILGQSGLKISGNILRNLLYKTFVLPPVSGLMKRKDVKVTTAYGTNQTNSGGTTQYVNFVEAADPEGLFASSVYTANKNTRVIITLSVTFVQIIGLATSANISVIINGGSVGSIIAFSGTPSVVIDTSIQSGQTISVQFSRGVPSGSVVVALNIRIDIPTIIAVNDYIKPNYFLPPLRSLDIIKFIISYFGCSVYFDEHSKTLNINQIETLKEEDADDWSDYLLSITVDYTVAGAANNYLRLQESDDTEIKAYNKESTLKYGEGNILTDNTLKDNNEIIKIPFAATEFGLAKNGTWLSNIGLYGFKDAGEPIFFKSIIDNGGSNPAGFIVDGEFISGSSIGYQVVRIVDDTAGDLGLFISAGSGGYSATETEYQFYGLVYPGATSTGKLYPQEVVFNTIKPRVLLVKPSTTYSDFSSASSFNTQLSATSRTSAPFSHFSKPTVGLPVDKHNANAAFQNPDIDGFTHPSVVDTNFTKIKRMMGNPVSNAKMLLPEGVFQKFAFDRFIYLKMKDVSGYYWVDGIYNYTDSKTPVDVKLLML